MNLDSDSDWCQGGESISCTMVTRDPLFWVCLPNKPHRFFIGREPQKDVWVTSFLIKGKDIGREHGKGRVHGHWTTWWRWSKPYGYSGYPVVKKIWFPWVEGRYFSWLLVSKTCSRWHKSLLSAEMFNALHNDGLLRYRICQFIIYKRGFLKAHQVARFSALA